MLDAYLAAFDPRRWLPLARVMRASEGSCPPMMLIAVFGTFAFGSAFLRGSPLLTSLLYAWAFCWTMVAAMAAAYVMSDSLRNMARFGVRAIARSRLWFELARCAWVSGLMTAIPASLLGYLDPPLLNLLGQVASHALVPCFATFCVASTIGYAVLFATGQHVSGRARECVQFFYPFCMAGLSIFAFFLLLRSRLSDPWTYGPMLAILVAVCLFGAIMLSVVDRRRSQSPAKHADTPR